MTDVIQTQKHQTRVITRSADEAVKYLEFLASSGLSNGIASKTIISEIKKDEGLIYRMMRDEAIVIWTTRHCSYPSWNSLKYEITKRPPFDIVEFKDICIAQELIW